MGVPAAPAQSNRRALIMLAVGGGALLLFLLVSQVLGGGGDDDDLSAPITVPRGTGTPRVTTTTGVTPGPPPEETFEVFSTKNPFTPLVGGTGTGTGTGGGTVVTTPPATGGGTTVTTPTTSPPSGGGSTVVTTAPPTGGGTGGGGTEPRVRTRVALLDVYADDGRRVANVRVNDTVYEAVAPGEEFATSFRLVSLDDTCGTFLYGDDRFRLCQGEEVLK
jgi:hypothetical protein